MSKMRRIKEIITHPCFLAATILVTAFLAWQSEMSVELKMNESISRNGDLVMTSGLAYTWGQISENLPYAAVQCIDRHFFTVTSPCDPAKLKITVKKITYIAPVKYGTLCLVPVDGGFYWNNYSRQLTFRNELIPQFGDRIWQDFRVILEVEIFDGGKPELRTFEFEHHIRTEKTYGLYFLSALMGV